MLPAAKKSLILKFVEYRPMVEVSVREDSVNSTADRAEFCYGRFLDTDSATEIRHEFIGHLSKNNL